jgi:hypothetical protein
LTILKANEGISPFCKEAFLSNRKMEPEARLMAYPDSLHGLRKAPRRQRPGHAAALFFQNT